jgi:hypothetical protein
MPAADERLTTNNQRLQTVDDGLQDADKRPTTTDQPPPDDTLAARLRQRRQL